jgi:7-cyano-7-deazaguanine synthase
MKDKVIVLLSGGIDSATTLAKITAEGHECCALSIAYGQRHDCELVAAKKLVKAFNVTEHRIVDLDIAQWGGSSLTDTNLDVPVSGEKKPSTYVPARNIIFLSLALAWAEVVGAHAIYFSATKMDFDHYPDCRPDFFSAYENAANLATRFADDAGGIKILTPLIDCNKADIIRMGFELGVDFSMTWSCYNPQLNNKPCGLCDACVLRQQAFVEVGKHDPLLKYDFE